VNGTKTPEGQGSRGAKFHKSVSLREIYRRQIILGKGKTGENGPVDTGLFLFLFLKPPKYFSLLPTFPFSLAYLPAVDLP